VRWLANTGVNSKVKGLSVVRTSVRSLCGMPTASEDMLKSPPSGLTPATGYVHSPCMNLARCAPVLYQQSLRPKAGNNAWLVAMPSPFTGTPLEMANGYYRGVSSLGPCGSRASFVNLFRECSWLCASSSSCLLTCTGPYARCPKALLRACACVYDTCIQLKTYILQL
jgi:hypothetical protein